MSPPSSGAQRRIALLLDSRALTAIAEKLLTIRTRLSLHTDGRVPSIFEVVAALRVLIKRCDNERSLASPVITSSYSSSTVSSSSSSYSSSSTSSSNPQPIFPQPQQPQQPQPPQHPYPSSAPSLRLLVHLLGICNATYNMQDDELFQSMLFSLHLPLPIIYRKQADQFAPGYVLVRDSRRGGALLLCIRGSREVGDLLTNLSSDATKFLAGYAHEGIANSARQLHAALRPVIASELSSSTTPLKHGLIIFGHSLGGAVAAALTMLFRYKRVPENEHPLATDIIMNARCYSFAPPPFLDQQLATHSRNLPITSIAYGLDLIPRLSPASMDRLLHKLAAFDFSPQISSVFSKVVRSVTQPVIGSKEADALASRAADVRVDAKKIATVGATVATVAQAALQTQAQKLMHEFQNPDEARLTRSKNLKPQKENEKSSRRLRSEGSKSSNDKSKNKNNDKSGSAGGKAIGKKDDGHVRQTKYVGKTRGAEKVDVKSDKLSKHKSSPEGRLEKNEKSGKNSEKDRAKGNISGNRKDDKKHDNKNNIVSKHQSGEDQSPTQDSKNGKANTVLAGSVATAAALWLTGALGNQLESHAVRYAERKTSGSTSSTQPPSRERSPVRGHPSASLDFESGVRGGQKTRSTSRSKRQDISSPAIQRSQTSKPSSKVPDGAVTHDMEELYLAGEVWHIDKPFVATPPSNLENLSWPVPQIVRKSASDFRDIEASAWMVQDHDTTLILRDLERMLEQQQEREQERRKRQSQISPHAQRPPYSRSNRLTRTQLMRTPRANPHRLYRSQSQKDTFV